MTTILGTDGDTTGSVVAAWKTAADVTAALLAATHSTQGALTPAEFDAIAAYLAGTLNGQAIATLDTSAINVESFTSNEINFQAVAIVDIVMPLRAGKKFYFLTSRGVTDTRDAALTTGWTWNLAQNGASISGSVATATSGFNNLAAPQNFSASPTNVSLVDMTTHVLQVQTTVGVAGAGLTTCTGRLVILGYYA